MLIIGGWGEASAAPPEVFDPTPDPLSESVYDSQTGEFESIAIATAQPRRGHTATLLPDGRILVVGGASAEGELASAELVDPVAGTSMPLSSQLGTPRARHTATLRTDGTVLIVGGASGGRFLRSLEIYDTPGRPSREYRRRLRSHEPATLRRSCPMARF